jgi:predicted MPP superfamily phosphohydrolase
MLVYACYHSLLSLIVLLLLYSIWRETYTSFLRFRLLAWCGGLSAIFFALIFSHFIGGRVSLNLAIHGLAWYGTFFLFASALLMYRQKSNGKPRRRTPSLIFMFGCIYFGVAANTLLFEPTALVIKEMTITTPKITKPITIVFASDLQAERIGHYERWTLQKIKEQNADLIILGGDYTQGRSVEESRQALKNWNQLFRELDLHAPLGIYAVRGTHVHDWDWWKEKFNDTAIIPLEETVIKSIGEVRITFLSSQDSWERRTIPDDEREGKFRIIAGHHPLYAMATQEAELLLAGHTHGGQVQIPFWGLPIVTYSGPFPTQWATGTTTMANGALLIVSHGTGLSSGSAPRVRFWCRPDFWVIRLVPERQDRASRY